MRRTTKNLLLTALLAGLLACPRLTRADSTGPLPEALRDVGIDEHPNAQLPLQMRFFDDHGHAVDLGDYFKGKKPVVLQLGYFECPMLCGLVSHGLIDAARETELKAGTDYDLVFVSIHPAETPTLAAQARQTFVHDYGKADEANGFHFLVGNPQDVKALADTVGFRFHKVPGTEQIAHPAVLFICTPDGRVSRYLYGVSFVPRTLRLSLVEASNGKIGTTVDRILMFCYHYDPDSQGYKLAIGVMRTGGILSMLSLGLGITYLVRREHRGAASIQRLEDQRGEDQ
jgi:protein SCO1